MASYGNTTGVSHGNMSFWSEGNSTRDWSKGDSVFEETVLHPVTGNADFPPLSQQPINPSHTMSADNPADRYVLEKQTPAPPGQENFKVQKNLNELVPESEKMMSSQLQVAKHSHAITMELKLLLENERKILNQIVKRCEKFSKLKEENKQSTEEWNDETQRRIPLYEDHMIKLNNYPDDEALDGDAMAARIQQKVLLEIVSKTILAANNMSVQLSMENTIINDIDNSLLDLKQRSVVMLRQVGSWLRMLTMLEQNQEAVVERWRSLRRRLKELRERARKEEEAALGLDGKDGAKVLSLVKSFDDRIKSLEKLCKDLTEAYNRACAASCPPPVGGGSRD